MRRLPLLLVLALPLSAAVVDDVTRLNPIVVERVVRPKTVDEVRRLVRRNDGPISIGGGRYSMGGQTATDGALVLDMRGMDKVLAVSDKGRLLTVEAGITWRKIQEAIDPLGLSLKIMQSYANFTVGGSLSVNSHGRYVNLGPLIRSVRGLKLVLADGRLVTASPSENAELFYGAIGGYGGLGVIVEATLELAENARLERSAERVKLSDYRAWFDREIRRSKTAVFHNADLYPPRYEEAMAITYSKTERPATVEDRLQPTRRWRGFERLAVLAISELPFGKELRRRYLDPWTLRGRPVVWRNYEASYDVADLEPRTRRFNTYVLQEYFVPAARLEEFVPKMAEAFKRGEANVLNVSIRHALKDTGSMLAWARGEVFAFVVYYKQGTSAKERERVASWTRELIDAVLSVGGTYYLPYQIVATDAQFHRAYPRAKEFFALKARVDPAYKFRNRLWDRYLPAPKLVKAELLVLDRPGYKRGEDQTLLTMPEWHIVYAADELARHLKEGRPSRFPYLKAVGQFWSLYSAARAKMRGRYVDYLGYLAMVDTIGVSFSLEYLLKGLYEGTVGRLTEPASPGPEDKALAELAADYAAFMHHTPWYEYPFWTKRREFLEATKGTPRTLRRAERRLSASLELAAKAVWGRLIKKATGAAYAPEDLKVQAFVSRPGGAPRLESLPRYDPFTKAAEAVAKKGGRFVEIAGNRRIALTVLAPAKWDGALWGEVVWERPLLTEPAKKRVALLLPVEQLAAAFAWAGEEEVAIEHAYDY